MIRVLLMACACGALQDAETLVRAGSAKFDKGDFKGALQDFDRAVEVEPGRADAHLGRGKAKGRLDALAEAEASVSRAIELDPGFAEAYVWRGWLRQKRGEHEPALKDFAKAEQLKSSDAALSGMAGYSLSTLGRHAEAELQYNRALERSPSAQGYFGRMWSRYAQLNLRGAIVDATRVIELEPSYQAAYQYRSLAYFGEESWENALRDTQTVAELQGSLNDVGALWMFQCRCRLGQKEKAVEALKEHLKDSAQRKGDLLLKHVLAFQVGYITEAELLEAVGQETAPEAARTAVGVAAYHVGVRRLLAGSVEEAMTHFETAAAKLKGSMLPESILSRVELAAHRRKKKAALIEDLEAKVRALKPFEVVYDLNIPWKDDDESAVDKFTIAADFGRGELLWTISGKNKKEKKEFLMFLHLKDAALAMWAPEHMGVGYHTMDLSAMRDMHQLFDEGLRKLLPEVAKEDVAVSLALTLALEGKPSKDEQGTIRFAVGFASHPLSWLNDILHAEDATWRQSGEELAFEIPSRRKSIVIDRATGMLRSLEARDYDQTPRRISRVSMKELAAFPTVQRPAKVQRSSFDVAQFKDQMRQQETLLQSELTTAVEAWERLVKEGKDEAVAAIFTRWAARYTDGLHAYAVRSFAGQRIQRALDLGTPPATLAKEAEEEARRFASQFKEERKQVAEYKKGHLEELLQRSETGLIEGLMDSRLHESMRKTLRRVFDPASVEALRQKTYGDRLEQLFREELAARTQL